MLKSAIVNAVGRVFESAALRSVISRAARMTTNVIYYHYVGEAPPHYRAFNAGCTVARFEEDLQLLRAVFDFASLEEVLAERSETAHGMRPRLAVTFDDGLKVARPEMLEILHRHGVHATAFLITSCIDNKHLMWRHLLSAVQALAPADVWRSAFNNLAQRHGFRSIQEGQALLAATSAWNHQHKDSWSRLLWEGCGLMPIEDYLGSEQPYLTWGEVDQWLQAGHSIGFHTHTHPFCSRLQEADLESEIIEPALGLRERLKLRSLSLSYPFGEPLRAEFEEELFRRRIFSQTFGIRGLSRKAPQAQRVERAGAEGGNIGFAVFARTLLPV
jgi:peptidoglycan/xylan/chitin deacetylase (PgdA/CDA1 family)